MKADACWNTENRELCVLPYEERGEARQAIHLEGKGRFEFDGSVFVCLEALLLVHPFCFQTQNKRATALKNSLCQGEPKI